MKKVQWMFVTVLLLITTASASQRRNAQVLTGKVDVGAFSIFLPKGWYAQRQRTGQGLPLLFICNRRNFDCTWSGGGFPKKGTMTLVVLPSVMYPEGTPYKSLEELMLRARNKHDSAPQDVTLPASNDSLPRHCMVSTELLADEIRTNTFGCEIAGKFFQAVAQYDDAAARKDEWDGVALAILSSLRPASGQ